MNIKKQLSTGLLSAFLGISLIGGGTYAYFSNSAETTNTFAAGTLDLAVNPTQIIDVNDMKPGDTFIRDFELQNSGSLDIGKVLLTTAYTVTDAKGDNTEDFGEHIEVEFLYNMDKLDEVIYKTTLAQLKNMNPEVLNERVFEPIFNEKGLPTGKVNDLVVKFNFIDNGKDQNQFQGDSLDLTWTFNAHQTDGKQR
ncbi:CalY family protein [Lederbergia lenta]|uniref:Spore coat-associated protein n=1 Tax=Lederbergia lenta TaxID=1467 RepID=A0A2X4WW62_LEDLE|nr:CalY family protein [Lederbergia lenta]MEC2323105.1 CalY family protein [Lederbergia lenta]SQI62732.1 spore coat-associated protein [Lederbergia lenta]